MFYQCYVTSKRIVALHMFFLSSFESFFFENTPTACNVHSVVGGEYLKWIESTQCSHYDYRLQYKWGCLKIAGYALPCNHHACSKLDYPDTASKQPTKHCPACERVTQHFISHFIHICQSVGYRCVFSYVLITIQIQCNSFLWGDFPNPTGPNINWCASSQNDSAY